MLRRSKAHALALSLLITIALAGNAGCLVRRRAITRKGASSTAKLLNADKQTLLNAIAERDAAIRTLNATVDMVPAVGSADKGKITEYKDVRAYFLIRKPSQIRLIGLYPVVRGKAFDMVSDGKQFSLFIPSKNRWISGKNEIIQPSANKLENLRPQHFLDAILVKALEKPERQVIENLTDEDGAFYIVQAIESGADGELYLRRQVWFDRVNLQIVRQLIFDDSGDILTDARYSDWHRFDNVPFPRKIEINRPKDEYGVVITVVKLELNRELGDDKFVLEKPPDAEVKVIGEGAPQPPAPQQPAQKQPAQKQKGKRK